MRDGRVEIVDIVAGLARVQVYWQFARSLATPAT